MVRFVRIAFVLAFLLSVLAWGDVAAIESFDDWSGLVKAEGESWLLKLPGKAEFVYPVPENAKGNYWSGFETYNDYAQDWRDYKTVEFDINVPEGKTVNLRFTVDAYEHPYNPLNIISEVKVSGPGWRHVVLPLEQFTYNTGSIVFWRFIVGASLEIDFTDGSKGLVYIKNLELEKDQPIKVDCAVRGQGCDIGGTVVYDLTVENTSDELQNVSLFDQKYGWETMEVVIEPSDLAIQSGKTALVQVAVSMSDAVAVGGRERQNILAVPRSVNPHVFWPWLNHSKQTRWSSQSKPLMPTVLRSNWQMVGYSESQLRISKAPVMILSLVLKN